MAETHSGEPAGAGFTKATPSNFTSDFNPYGVRGIFNGAAIIFFAYLGYDAVATLAEEVRAQACSQGVLCFGLQRLQIHLDSRGCCRYRCGDTRLLSSMICLRHRGQDQ